MRIDKNKHSMFPGLLLNSSGETCVQRSSSGNCVIELSGSKNENTEVWVFRVRALLERRGGVSFGIRL